VRRDVGGPLSRKGLITISFVHRGREHRHRCAVGSTLTSMCHR
jgi:hypothetical protein